MYFHPVLVLVNIAAHRRAAIGERQQFTTRKARPEKAERVPKQKRLHPGGRQALRSSAEDQNSSQSPPAIAAALSSAGAGRAAWRSGAFTAAAAGNAGRGAAGGLAT